MIEEEKQLSPVRLQNREFSFQTPKKSTHQDIKDTSPPSNNENFFGICQKIAKTSYEQKIANQSTQAHLSSPFLSSPNLSWKTPQSFLKTNPFNKSPLSENLKMSGHTPISPYSDRYIPYRQERASATIFQVSKPDKITPFDSTITQQQTCSQEDKIQKQQLYQSLLQENLLEMKLEQGDQLQQQSVLQFKNKFPQQNDYENNKFLQNSDRKLATHKRKIESQPQKVLDAPGLSDDFYQDILHWGKQNLIAVGLNQAVYLYNCSNGKVFRVAEQYSTEINYFTSLQWNTSGQILSIGAYDGQMLFWDMEKQMIQSKMQICQKRIATINWANNNIFACGSKDRSIVIGDIRVPGLIVNRWQNAHSQEICGVTFADNECQLASGGNDNKVHIWSLNAGIQNIIQKNEEDQNKNHLQWTIREHKAAVRALAWNPHTSGQIVTGGGSADKTIRAFSTFTQTQLCSVDVDSQVCKLQFSRNTEELVSTHGYERHQVLIWNYPQMKKVSCLEGHSQRVLYMSMSPDDTVLVTGAGDETLKFWNLFPKIKSFNKSDNLKISDFR